LLSREIRKFIQEPVLARAGWTDESSKLIIYLTGMTETGYSAIMQKGTPANGGIGWYQEEPSDYSDMLIWLKNGFNRDLLNRCLNACHFIAIPEDIMTIAENSAWATLVCRMHYHRIREPLPPLGKDNTPELYAQYYKKYYNSVEGDADVSKVAELCRRIIHGEI